MKMKAKIAVLVLALAWICQGCGSYSFSGASIPAEARTISVDYFPNHAQLVNPLLSDNFTTALRAALNRLTITVRVRFTNNIDDSKDFEQTFSRYEDYPSDQDLNSVQESLTSTIIEQLVEDIFNKALVNW